MISGFICAATIIVNMTAVWTPNDAEELKIATKRCATIYPEAPCLKKLVKKEDHNYWAICGEAKKK